MSYYKMEERRNNEMMLQLHQLLINYKESTNSKWSRMEETLRSVVQELRGISDALNKKEQEECDVGEQQLIPVLGLQKQHSEGPPVFDEDPNKEDYDLEEQKIILEALEIQEVQAKGPQTPIIALELFDESSKEEEINEESELAEKYAVQGCSTIHFFAKGEKLIAFDYMPKGKSGRPEIDKSKRPEYQEGSRKSVTIYIYDPGGNFSYPQGILLSVSTGLQKLTQQEVGRSKSNHEDMVDFQGGRIVRIALEDQYLLVVHAKVGSIGATTAVSQAKGVMT